jgi:hypothetical protein
MKLYETIMGRDGPICKLIGTGDCNNCKAKQFKMTILPYKGLNKNIYKRIKRCWVCVQWNIIQEYIQFIKIELGLKE